MGNTRTTPEAGYNRAAEPAIAQQSNPTKHHRRKPARDRRLKGIPNKLPRYLLSLFGGLLNRNSFASVETFCLFIGYARSGHSLVGSLLDAHPNAVIADELDALKYVQAGFSQNQIFYLLLRNSQQAASSGRERTGYSYSVPSQWQGRFKEPRVIGDKMGRSSSVRLGAFPHLLDILFNDFPIKPKFIHVMRNPYDIISTMALRRTLPLESSCKHFFSAAEDVEKIKQHCESAAMYDLRHEDFVADPKGGLRELCAFLNMKEDSDYVDACARIVYPSPHKSREKLDWTPSLIESVGERISRFPFLSGYSFDA